MVLSDSAGSEEEESSSEDETTRAEIERVLDGRPNADSKQEEFLVKFKGTVPSSHTLSLYADHPHTRSQASTCIITHDEACRKWLLMEVSTSLQLVCLCNLPCTLEPASPTGQYNMVEASQHTP